MSNLIPDYRDTDFQTMVERLRILLSNTDSFKDYDFEGANITVLMELLAYVGDLNTYFTNKLAENIHTETANIYEVVHSLVRQQGYEPSGYVGAVLTLTVRVYEQDLDVLSTYNFYEDDQLYIPQWFSFDTGQKDTSGNSIYYTLTEDVYFTVKEEINYTGLPYTTKITGTVPNRYVDFDITLRQGQPYPLIEYTGNDIVSNQIILPFSNFDMSTYPYDTSSPSIVVTVGDDETPWVRINDWFDEISGLLLEKNAYMLTYDKYQRSVLTFSNTRNVPALLDPINVYLLETLGVNGSITANTFSIETDADSGRKVQSVSTTTPGVTPSISTILGTDTGFITNLTNDWVVPVVDYVLSNTSPSTSGANPQELEELKAAGMAASNSQLRNVTRTDYIGNLEARGDIVVANVWGEQEENPHALTRENYNKAYISLIPVDMGPDTEDTNVVVKSVEIEDDFSNNILKALDFPESYNAGFVTNILQYLEPRKMLGIYEILDETTLPELVYFKFDIGLKVKRTYNWIRVKTTVLNKLIHYFSNVNRNFGEVIDFREIYNYILDVTNVSSTDDFALVRGIHSLVIRDVMTYRDLDRLEQGVVDEDQCLAMNGTWDGSGVAVMHGVSVTSLVGTMPDGWYYGLPTTNTSSNGVGLTIDVQIASNDIIGVTVDWHGSGYEVLDTMSVPCSLLGATSGTLDFEVQGIGAGACDIDYNIDEMYIYPDNVHGYFPHWISTGYNHNSVDTIYNQIEPVQLGFKQFPQLASDLCVFTNEG